MSYAATSYEHIALDTNEVPVINGTGMKVLELIQSKLAYGWSPEELHFQYPYLTMGQIYSALAYYSDHQEELDSDIERRLREVEELQEKRLSTPLEVRLKSEGFI